MSFDIASEAYGAFMGRYSEPLARLFAADVQPGQRVLDVGCGPGALTAVLVDAVGPAQVCAVDPSAPFLAAIRQRLPEVDVRQASAAELPFADDEFDVVLAQLVVHFMADPVAGLVEMRRVARPGALVGACVWDHASGGSPLAFFWRAAHTLDPDARDEAELPGSWEGHLAELMLAAGFSGITSMPLTVEVEHAAFADWWEPYTLGVGPAGDYVASLRPEERTRLRGRCEELAPPFPMVVTATAWTAYGQA